MGNAEQIQRQFAELGPPAAATEGVVIDQDWDNGIVTVNVGGTEQRMKWASSPPWPGDRVRIVSAGGAVFCVPVWGAPLGTVQFTGSGGAVVLGDDAVTYTYPHLGAAPADGARVRLDHAGRCVLSGVYAVEPADSEFVPAPAPPAAGGGEAWFNPAWSGNWRPGFSGSAVEISSTRVGLYGYGTQIRDTIPDSATVLVADLHLTQNWDNVPGVASSMGTHGFDGSPGSATNANLSGTYSVAGGSRVVNLLGTVADGLKTGSALGVGFRSGSSGWRQYGAAPGSGRIFMKWS
jgi:hypothetical protein